MWNWLMRWRSSGEAKRRQEFFQRFDHWNASLQGGRPETVDVALGCLRVPSQTLLLFDPMRMASDVVLPGIASQQVEVACRAWRYPRGGVTPITLQISCKTNAKATEQRLLGELLIDSASVALADAEERDSHWEDVGPDRIGVLSLIPNDTILKKVIRKFGLQVRPRSVCSAAIVDPVSPELEAAINDYLQKELHCKYPLIHFYVDTNRTSSRALQRDSGWQRVRIGAEPSPEMLVIQTGRGDGAYRVYGHFAGSVPVQASVDFLDDTSAAEN